MMKRCLFFIFMMSSLNAFAVQNDQNRLDQINAQYEEMAYSLEEPLVIQNPFSRNELSALLKFSTPEESTIKLTIQKKDGTPSLSYSFNEFKSEHTIPVLGLYANHLNQIQIEASNKNKEKQTSIITIQTPKVNKRALYIVKEKKDSQNIFHYLHDGIVFDEDGHIRMSFKGDFEMLYYSNGELIAEDRNLGLIRYDLLGQKKQTYQYPENFVSFTHGLTQKPNKNFLVIGSFTDKKALFNQKQAQTQREFIIEIDYQTGKTVNVIDLAEILNPDRSVIIKSDTQNYGLNNWCHINSVAYDAKDNGILISCRHAGLQKIHEKTKEPLFILSPHKGFEKSGRNGQGPSLEDKLLTALDSKGKPLSLKHQEGSLKSNEFKWPTKTHDAKITKEGYISVFDNSGAVYDKNLVSTRNSNAQVFKIDPEKKTVQSVWFMPLEFYSASGSSVIYDTDTNNVSVYASVILDNEQIGWGTGRLLRFDLKTKEKLFDAVIYRGGETYFYGIQSFSFYPKEEK